MTRGWKLDRGIQHCPRGEERKLGVQLKMGRLRGRWEYRRFRGWRVGLDDGDVSLYVPQHGCFCSSLKNIIPLQVFFKRRQ